MAKLSFAGVGLLLLIGSGRAAADVPACAPHHQSCEAWKKKAFETTGENPEDYRQMKIACTTADDCERFVERQAMKAADEARAKREAEEIAAARKREAEIQEEQRLAAAENERRMAEAAEQAAQAKASRRPVAYGAAICVQQERARNAQPARVTYSSGNVAITRDVSRAAQVRSLMSLARKLRANGEAERVKILPCRDAKVRAVVRCVIQPEGACGDDSAVDDVHELINNIVTADE